MKQLTEKQVTLILQAIGMAIWDCDRELDSSVTIEHRDYFKARKEELFECSKIISSLGVEDEQNSKP